MEHPSTDRPAPLSSRFAELAVNLGSDLGSRRFRRDLEKLERHQQAMMALIRVAQEVSRVAGVMDLNELVSFVLTQALELVGAERGLLVLRDRDSGALEVASARHLREDADPSDVALSHSLVQRVVDEGRAIVTTNAQDDPRFAQQLSIMDLSIRSVLAVPLASSAGTLGALYLDTRITTRVFDEADLPVVEAFAGITASAIELVHALQARRELHLESVRALVNAVEAKDPYTAGHSSRVGIYAQGILRATGADEHAAEEALIAGYLHDIGKIGIDSSYVNKPGPLTTAEYTAFKHHTVIGEQILSHARALKPILPAVRWHHERLDGRGYPDNLRGDEIPLLARVVGVCDSFDAMTTDRVYRPSLGLTGAIGELQRYAGTQFDPALVEVFVGALRRGDIRFLGKNG